MTSQEVMLSHVIGFILFLWTKKDKFFSYNGFLPKLVFYSYFASIEALILRTRTPGVATSLSADTPRLAPRSSGDLSHAL